MKKILSLLSVLTISGTSFPMTIAASSYQPEILKRVKRGNTNKLENWYCFLCHNRLIAKISYLTWKNIQGTHKQVKESEFRNYLFSLLNNFEKRNHSGDIQDRDKFWQDDIKIIIDVILDHYYDINRVFNNLPESGETGLIISTNRASYWVNRGSENGRYWGAFDNNE